MDRSKIVHSWVKGETQEVRVVLAQDDSGPERLHLRYFSRGFPTRRGVTFAATLKEANELVRGATAARDYLEQRDNAT